MLYSMFTAELFTITKAYKQPKYSSTDEWIKNACMLSHFSHVQLFATLWTVAHQAPLSMGFSRQDHWSGLPCPPPGDLPSRD